MNDLEKGVAFEQGKLLNKALKIIDKLAENNLADMDGDISINEIDVNQIKDLILDARTIKSNQWWFSLIKDK